MRIQRAWCNMGMMVLLMVFCVFILPPILLQIMPFILGWLLSLFISPLVKILEEKLKIKRKAGTAAVLLFLLAGSVFLTGMILHWLQKEIQGKLPLLPEIWKQAEQELLVVSAGWENMKNYFPEQMAEQLQMAGESLGKEVGTIIGKISLPTAGAVGDIARSFPKFVFAAFMTLLSCYFFVVEKGKVEDKIIGFFSREKREKCKMLKQTTFDVMIGYIKAQLKIELWIYLLLSVGLYFLKIDTGFLWALPIALLDLFPLFGTGLILIPWSLMLLLKGTYFKGLGMLILWGGSLLLRQMIQPRVLGKSLGISPLFTLFLLYLGCRLAGVTGMLFSVPIGILIITMNEAGFFHNLKLSFKVIWKEFQGFYREEG